MNAHAEKQLIQINQRRIDSTLSRIDAILHENKQEQRVYLILVVTLFAAGIICLLYAFLSNAFAWSIPSAITTALLHWPLKQIRDLRQKNIALAIIPMLVALLPPEKAEQEIQQLIKKLYD